MAEQPAPRLVAGLRCDQVLDRLPDFVDGCLSADDLAQVGAHLAGCDWCARFGGRYAQIVLELHQELGAAPAPDMPTADRLRRRLLDELK